MVCASCGRREAAFFFQVIAGNKVAEKALCGECSSGEEGAMDPASALLGLLAGLAPSRGKVHPARCPGCQATYAQFRAKGRFGCPDCYERFAPQVRTLLPRVHGGAYQHRGKAPRGGA